MRPVPGPPARLRDITDMADALTTIVSMLEDSGMEAIIIDITGPEHTAQGLHCARAIVPGAVPLTFGHTNRRLDGIPRLFSAPHRLGFTQRSLTTGELNSDPHPFA